MNTQELFGKEIKARVQKELDIKNSQAVVQIAKIVLNIGLKEALKDEKILDEAKAQLAQITGQKPVVTRAKAAIAGFKLRKGDAIGVMVTLRGKRMRDFFTKLVGVVLPRVRDFHGVPKTSFDGNGNYTLGLSEMSVFPEIDTGKTMRSFGLEMTINTTVRKDDQAQKLLEIMGMPFRKVKS
ncbi:50S ribosomal protein L5 [Candidatus Microgenomates bacterium]|nr:50S ribosomal protein L5 [Candidatus Microgenomates bacterium]